MKQTATNLALAAAIAASCPAAAMPGGELDTLPIGGYACERTGDITGETRIAIPEESFRIINASSYKVGGERGTYLLTGDRAVMTSGPFKGKRYTVLRRGFLVPESAAGEETPMRCVLSNRNNR